MLTQKRLKEVLHYNPKTGIFRWIKKTTYHSRINIGNIAGYKQNGYIIITIDNKPYGANRLAWLYIKGYFPEYDVDHKDRIRNNNKWKNLRHITRSCNLKNSSLSKNNTSKITGVSKINNKWMVFIGHLNKRIHIGYFKNFIEAVKARYEAEIKYGYLNCNNTSTAYLYLKERSLL